jgi:tetratricopeptide (TPR) repeat protein
MINMPVSTKPLALYAEHMLGAQSELASGRNETQRDLCRAYLASGERLLSKKKMELAVEHLEEALHVAQQNDDLIGQALGHSRLGRAYFLWDDLEQSLSCYQSALHIARQLAAPRGQGYILFNIGLVLMELRDHQHAVELAYESLHVLEQIDDSASKQIGTLLQAWEAGIG